MLHWLRNNRSEHNRQRFWIKLLAVSCVCHGALIFVIFFLYKDDMCQYNMTVNSKNLRPGAPIIFMPFRKVVNAHRLTGQLATSIVAVKTTTVGLIHEMPAKKAATSLVDEQERKHITQRQLRAKKLREKRLAEKKERAKRERDETIKKLEKKECEEKLKKKREEEEHAEKKRQHEEELKKASEVAQKVAQEQTTKHDEPVVQPAQPEQLIAQPGAGQYVGSGDGVQEPVYVGQVEMEELDRQEELQQELSTHWRPPAGLREGLTCVLAFQVDAEGSATNVTVQKSSGVLVYDMAARMAISHMQMPQWARGKELSITFI